MRLVGKVKRPKKKEVRPLAPATVEALRAACQPRDATLISVLAYSGYGRRRRSPCAGATFESERSWSGAVSLGEEAGTKTTAHRTVRLLAPLREDLLAWKLRSGRPRDSAAVFPGPEGRSWSKTSYDNWRGRNFDRAL